MPSERMPGFNNEALNSGEVGELPRQTAQAIGEAAMRAALIDAKPPASSLEHESTPLSPDKQARVEALIKMQQQEIAAEGGKSVNDSILDRAEKAPDVYSQSELIDAKIATSEEAIIAALATNPKNHQLIEMLKSALGELKASGVEEFLKYDPATKQLSGIEKSAADHASTTKIINFPTPDRPTQPEVA